MASSKGINIPASVFGKAKMGSESWILGALVLGPNYLGPAIMTVAVSDKTITLISCQLPIFLNPAERFHLITQPPKLSNP